MLSWTAALGEVSSAVIDVDGELHGGFDGMAVSLCGAEVPLANGGRNCLVDARRRSRDHFRVANFAGAIDRDLHDRISASTLT